MFFSAGLWFLFRQKKKWRSIILFILLIALPVISYYILPTFQNRVKYFLYDLSYFKNAEYLPGSNDGVRLLSIKAGWNVLNTNPFTGIGFGDIFAGAVHWYDNNYPQMPDRDKIYPSSEWIMYGAGCGWPGFILFTAVVVFPFFIKEVKKIYCGYCLTYQSR